MSALKRKVEKSDTLTLRIPAAVKAEIERLRPVADAQGFDVTASLVDAVVRCTKQIAEELNLYTKRTQAEATQFPNGGTK